MNGIHFLNGEWAEAENLKISAFDLGLTRGLAVFDTLRTYDGKPFMLNRHIERFKDGLSQLSIDLDVDAYDLDKVIAEGMDKNQLQDAVIRINATTGINEGRLSSSRPNFYIMFLPISLPDKSKYDSGQILKSFEVERTLPTVKTINYVAAKLALEAGDTIGADEALYLDSDGNMLETTISNIFFIRGDKVVTPETGKILNGITRQLVIELLGKQNTALEERKINIAELEQFDEAFACSTIKEIMAVSRVDDRAISNGAGDKTKQLASDFKEFVREIA